MLHDRAMPPDQDARIKALAAIASARHFGATPAQIGHAIQRGADRGGGRQQASTSLQFMPSSHCASAALGRAVTASSILAMAKHLGPEVRCILAERLRDASDELERGGLPEERASYRRTPLGR